MKSMIAISLGASDFWNRHHGTSGQISEEVAVRLPNVIFGSLTAVVIFLLAQELFDTQIALLAAFFWSVGTFAVIVNRACQRRYPAGFLHLAGVLFLLPSENCEQSRSASGWRWYAAAGASFGLMLASKYFPHYLGILILYWYLPSLREGYPGFRRREYLAIFGTLRSGIPAG